jgi:tRNA U34 5-methylaminomethyl-2-thiouridine-forming methyltransferase MnmC
LATLYALQSSSKKVRIVSPEMDEQLVRSLEHFTYPKVFAPFKQIITHLSQHDQYENDRLSISLFIGDAREFLQENQQKFDVVYHDAFSPEKNPILWTQEYFNDISRSLKEDGILTTYSTALRTRIALEQSGLGVYLNTGEGYRNATVASKSALHDYEKVDVAHKMACNPGVEALKDVDFSF